MTVKQIASILNTIIYPETTGESGVIQEDLSNIVEVGKEIDSTTLTGDNFDNFVKKVIDKVGKTIFVDRVYTSKAPNILKDSWTYGSALEKIRADAPDAIDSQEWNLANLANGSTVDPFIINKPSIDAKYYNNKSTFTIPLTIGRKQVREAFLSAENMNRFFSMIENRVLMNQTINTDAMIMRVINNLIANKINSENNVVNLLTEFKTATGNTTLTADKALENTDFLRFASRLIALYKGYISQASMLYNDAGYVTFTPTEKQKLVVLSEFAKAFEFNLYADTYNEEFVKMTGYSEIPYWQGSGTDNSFSEHSTINIKGVDMDGEEFTVNQSGIVGVLFDEDAAMVCNSDYEVGSIYNPRGKYENYFYGWDCSFMNDTAENCIVFIIADVVTSA